MSSFDDDIKQRQTALSALDDDEELVGDARRRGDRFGYEDDEDGTFTTDDLDKADHLARLMKSADGLNHKAALRQQKFQEQDQVAPHVSVNPPSANRGTLGGQQEVPLGGNMQVAMWAADADVETCPITVTFAPVQQLQASLVDVPEFGVAIRPYGIVQFGTRGFLVKAEVDIGLGCQFTVGASMVSLQVALEPPLVPGDVASMKLAGMLSFRPVIRTQNITRTRYITGLTNPGSTSVIVPPFAKSVDLWRSPITTDIKLEFLDQAGSTIYSFELAPGAYLFDSIPLSGDIVVVKVSNSGAAFANGIRLIFNLEF